MHYYLANVELKLKGFNLPKMVHFKSQYLATCILPKVRQQIARLRRGANTVS